MANVTFIPAFEAKVGDWNYYVCVMKYAQVDREVKFAHQLGGNKDLSTLIQRGISDRTADITDYLLKSDHRFLGALIVAAWGGQPAFTPLAMEDPDGMLQGVDNGFGVLSLDGSHSFFALDGQHRLQAIKDALNADPSLGGEDICMLLVAHYDTELGRERTQRLFTNINRNAKPTTAAENIALDVDDGFAVVLRELLTNHRFLKQQGVVKVFQKPPSGTGDFTLAGANVAKTDPRAWTTITVLYSLLKELGFGLDPSMFDSGKRPTEQVLEASEHVLGARLDQLLKAVGGLEERLADTSAASIRAPKSSEGDGHPMMRPVVQKAVARALNSVVASGALSWEDAMQRLADLDWRLDSAPWTAVFNPANHRMINAKENVELLGDLLVIHLAPNNKAQIDRAKKKFKEIRGSNYPVASEELAKGMAHLPQ